jgi:hypothetical protein
MIVSTLYVLVYVGLEVLTAVDMKMKLVCTLDGNTNQDTKLLWNSNILQAVR